MGGYGGGYGQGYGGYPQPSYGGYPQPEYPQPEYPEPPTYGGYPEPPTYGGYPEPPTYGGYPEPPPTYGGYSDYGYKPGKLALYCISETIVHTFIFKRSYCRLKEFVFKGSPLIMHIFEFC